MRNRKLATHQQRQNGKMEETTVTLSSHETYSCSSSTHHSATDVIINETESLPKQKMLSFWGSLMKGIFPFRSMRNQHTNEESICIKNTHSLKNNKNESESIDLTDNTVNVLNTVHKSDDFVLSKSSQERFSCGTSEIDGNELLSTRTTPETEYNLEMGHERTCHQHIYNLTAFNLFNLTFQLSKNLIGNQISNQAKNSLFPNLFVSSKHLNAFSNKDTRLSEYPIQRIAMLVYDTGGVDIEVAHDKKKNATVGSVSGHIWHYGYTVDDLCFNFLEDIHNQIGNNLKDALYLNTDHVSKLMHYQQLLSHIFKQASSTMLLKSLLNQVRPNSLKNTCAFSNGLTLPCNMSYHRTRPDFPTINTQNRPMDRILYNYNGMIKTHSLFPVPSNLQQTHSFTDQKDVQYSTLLNRISPEKDKKPFFFKQSQECYDNQTIKPSNILQADHLNKTNTSKKKYYYCGEVKKHKRNGWGALVNNNNILYEGNWRNDCCFGWYVIHHQYFVEIGYRDLNQCTGVVIMGDPNGCILPYNNFKNKDFRNDPSTFSLHELSQTPNRNYHNHKQHRNRFTHQKKSQDTSKVISYSPYLDGSANALLQPFLRCHTVPVIEQRRCYQKQTPIPSHDIDSNIDKNQSALSYSNYISKSELLQYNIPTQFWKLQTQKNNNGVIRIEYISPLLQTHSGMTPSVKRHKSFQSLVDNDTETPESRCKSQYLTQSVAYNDSILVNKLHKSRKRPLLKCIKMLAQNRLVHPTRTPKPFILLHQTSSCVPVSKTKKRCERQCILSYNKHLKTLNRGFNHKLFSDNERQSNQKNWLSPPIYKSNSSLNHSSSSNYWDKHDHTISSNETTNTILLCLSKNEEKKDNPCIKNLDQSDNLVSYPTHYTFVLMKMFINILQWFVKKAFYDLRKNKMYYRITNYRLLKNDVPHLFLKRKMRCFPKKLFCHEKTTHQYPLKSSLSKNSNSLFQCSINNINYAKKANDSVPNLVCQPSLNFKKHIDQESPFYNHRHDVQSSHVTESLYTDINCNKQTPLYNFSNVTKSPSGLIKINSSTPMNPPYNTLFKKNRDTPIPIYQYKAHEAPPMIGQSSILNVYPSLMTQEPIKERSNRMITLPTEIPNSQKQLYRYALTTPGWLKVGFCPLWTTNQFALFFYMIGLSSEAMTIQRLKLCGSDIPLINEHVLKNIFNINGMSHADCSRRRFLNAVFRLLWVSYDKMDPLNKFILCKKSTYCINSLPQLPKSSIRLGSFLGSGGYGDVFSSQCFGITMACKLFQSSPQHRSSNYRHSPLKTPNHNKSIINEHLFNNDAKNSNELDKKNTVFPVLQENQQLIRTAFQSTPSYAYFKQSLWNMPSLFDTRYLPIVQSLTNDVSGIIKNNLSHNRNSYRKQQSHHYPMNFWSERENPMPTQQTKHILALQTNRIQRRRWSQKAFDCNTQYLLCHCILSVSVNPLIDYYGIQCRQVLRDKSILCNPNIWDNSKFQCYKDYMKHLGLKLLSQHFIFQLIRRCYNIKQIKKQPLRQLTNRLIAMRTFNKRGDIYVKQLKFSDFIFMMDMSNTILSRGTSRDLYHAPSFNSSTNYKRRNHLLQYQCLWIMNMKNSIGTCIISNNPESWRQNFIHEYINHRTPFKQICKKYRQDSKIFIHRYSTLLKQFHTTRYPLKIKNYFTILACDNGIPYHRRANGFPWFLRVAVKLPFNCNQKLPALYSMIANYISHWITFPYNCDLFFYFNIFRYMMSKKRRLFGQCPYSQTFKHTERRQSLFKMCYRKWIICLVYIKQLKYVCSYRTQFINPIIIRLTPYVFKTKNKSIYNFKTLPLIDSFCAIKTIFPYDSTHQQMLYDHKIHSNQTNNHVASNIINLKRYINTNNLWTKPRIPYPIFCTTHAYFLNGNKLRFIRQFYDAYGRKLNIPFLTQRKRIINTPPKKLKKSGLITQSNLIPQNLQQSTEFNHSYHSMKLCNYEAEMLQLVSPHPYVIKGYGTIQFGSSAFGLLMELCQKGSLDKLIFPPDDDKKYALWKPLFRSEIIRYFEQAALGLAHVHEQHVLHRDIKLSNILVHEDGTARISDFGMATIYSAYENPALLAVYGNVYYAAPEVLRRDGFFPQSDVWSFGVAMWEAFTGCLAFDGVQPGVIFTRVACNDLGLTIPSSLPRTLRKLLNKMLHKDWEKRPTFTFIAEVLRNLRENNPIMVATQVGSFFGVSDN